MELADKLCRQFAGEGDVDLDALEVLCKEAGVELKRLAAVNVSLSMEHQIRKMSEANERRLRAENEDLKREIKELHRSPHELSNSEIAEFLTMACVGSCTCLTKTPELQFHAENCRFRVLAEAADRVEKADQWSSTEVDARIAKRLRNKK